MGMMGSNLMTGVLDDWVGYRGVSDVYLGVSILGVIGSGYVWKRYNWD